MPRALLSVTDKSGIHAFANGLKKLGFDIISTGGTAKVLRESGIEVTEVSEVTGFPEILDGRVKTLHPKIHGGLLARPDYAGHRAQLDEQEISPIDLLCVNLYAFEKTISIEHVFEDAIESIDIGGPAMIRAGAKNSHHVMVVVDPEDYSRVLDALESSQTEDLRKELQAKAFRHTAYYDSVIAKYLTAQNCKSSLTEILPAPLKKSHDMRYGENPHQHAALYRDPLSPPGIANAILVHGIELSYNNLLDADAAWELVAELPTNACAIIKHGNPSGVAQLRSAAESYRIARECDPVSAFGGIAAFNGIADIEAANAMAEKGNFLEVVIAEEFGPGAIDVFAKRSGWGQSVRLLAAGKVKSHKRITVRSIGGGVLAQDADQKLGMDWQVVTSAAPDETQKRALELQWIIAKHVKSNAIVIGDSTRLFGVGAGQMNRVHSVRLAIEQAGDKAKGAVLASDAFFPFPDSIEVAARAGVTCIIQPGGSKRDADVIETANRLGIAMVLTGVRHFRH